MTIMTWQCLACGGECAEDARPYMDRCTFDGPHTWTRILRGHCADCRAKIFVGEEYASITTGNVVRGRIGEPSDRITGVARGPTIYRCGGCLKSEGPLTR